jgi:hypothetical protein
MTHRVTLPVSSNREGAVRIRRRAPPPGWGKAGSRRLTGQGLPDEQTRVPSQTNSYLLLFKSTKVNLKIRLLILVFNVAALSFSLLIPLLKVHESIVCQSSSILTPSGRRMEDKKGAFI